jgi:hypothetical protein
VYLFASYFKWSLGVTSQPLDEENVGQFVQRANELLHATRIHATPA